MYASKIILPFLVALAGMCVAKDHDEMEDLCKLSYYALNFAEPNGELGEAISNILYWGICESNIPSNAAAMSGFSKKHPNPLKERLCCIDSVLPTSLHDEYSSYVSDMRTYARASSTMVHDLATLCSSIIPEVTTLSSEFHEMAKQTGAVCRSTASKHTITVTITTTIPVTTTTTEPTATTSNTIPTITIEPTPTTSRFKNKAARPTAFLAGALLAAAAAQ
ncbi:hypothetical protein F5Y18DRAFT_442800 [Xylariaceae sp. FL1019]|nr:hypothetical protein F5Y18DRAFT_442800 [Xylariaceae sp. FL1019]